MTTGVFVEDREGGLVARARLPIRLAHLGCKTLDKVQGTIKAAPTVATTLDQLLPSWAKKPEGGAVEAVSRALRHALDASGSLGFELWDTMRKGAEFWCVGDGLSTLANRFPGALTIEREETLCPSLELLGRLRESALPFPAFAQAYADELEQSGGLDRAVAAVVRAQARGRLATFMCTDPYVPGYARRKSHGALADGAGHGGYDDLALWPLAQALPSLGCHRVVLADLVVRRLRCLGLAAAEVQLLELDPTRGASTLR
jgi:hypothetical protein